VEVKFSNAVQVLREHEARPKLTTGILELDSVLAGGVELGTFNLFYGDCEPFIDRILYSLLCNCQLPLKVRVRREDGLPKLRRLQAGTSTIEP